MFKKLLRRLLILCCALLLCSVFSLYIFESANAIIADQNEQKNELSQASIPPAQLTQDSKVDSRKIKTEAAPLVNLALALNRVPAATPTKKPKETGQWLIIERSQSYDGQLQYYSPSNISLDGKRLVITTREEVVGNKSYTSGMVESNNGYLYGKFSFVISVSEGKGLFPAIWLMPVEDKALPEIDIFEMIGSEADAFYGVVHYMDGSVQAREFFKTKVQKKDTYLIELEWTKGRLRWFVDGECTLETSKFVPDEPMYLIVNQAVGGNWPGSPDKTTVFPATFILESWSIDPEWSQPR